MQPDEHSTATAARLAFGLILALSLILVTATFAPLWQPLVLAAVLSSATYGWYDWLSRKLGQRSRLAASVMTVALVVLVLVPIAAVLSVLIREGIEAVRFIQQVLERGGIKELSERLPEGLERLFRRVVEMVPVGPETLPEQAAAGGMTVARVVRDLLAGASKAIFGLVMMLIAYYALLLDGPRLLRWFGSISPLAERRTTQLLDEFRRVSRSVLSSSVLSSLAQAVVAGIGYLIAGVPNVIFFSFLTGLVALLPAIGTPLVTLPLVALLLSTGKIWQGIFLGIYWLLVIQVVDNIVKPLVVRGEMQINSAVIFFALIGGLLTFGPIGLIFGPLTVTFFLAMVRFARREYAATAARDQRGASSSSSSTTAVPRGAPDSSERE